MSASLRAAFQLILVVSALGVGALIVPASWALDGQVGAKSQGSAFLRVSIDPKIDFSLHSSTIAPESLSQHGTPRDQICAVTNYWSGGVAFYEFSADLQSRELLFDSTQSLRRRSGGHSPGNRFAAHCLDLALASTRSGLAPIMMVPRL